VDDSSRADNHLCEQFYKLLLKEFFMPALRKKFDLSLADLQKNLDVFVEDYNSRRLPHDAETPGKTLAATNFPVDL
jgi:transposase InsO family protein